MDYPPHGRVRAWVAVGVILAGFVIGGVGLAAGPAWWLFWTGVAIAGAGVLMAVAFDIFSDVILDEPRVVEEEVHHSMTRRHATAVRGGAHGETATKPTATDPSSDLHG